MEHGLTYEFQAWGGIKVIILNFCILIQDDKSFISNPWISYKDGTIYCDFYRDANTTIYDHLFDLKSPYHKYHILLAMGKTKDGG